MSHDAWNCLDAVPLLKIFFQRAKASQEKATVESLQPRLKTSDGQQSSPASVSARLQRRRQYLNRQPQRAETSPGRGGHPDGAGETRSQGEWEANPDLVYSGRSVIYLRDTLGGIARAHACRAAAPAAWELPGPRVPGQCFVK